MKLASGLAQQWLLVLPRPETRRGDMVLLRRCRRLSVPGAAVLGLFAAEAAVGMLCVCAFHTIPEISPYAILGAQPAGAQVVYGADTRRQQLVAGCGRRGHSLQTFGPDLSAVRRSVMFMAAEGGDKQPAEKEIEDLRRLSEQARKQPSITEAEALNRARALRSELEAKTQVRDMIAEKARQLLAKAAQDPRLAAAASDSAVEAVLKKNPQVALLDDDLSRIVEELRQLTPPGVCALAEPSKRHGYVREMNALPIVRALQAGNDRAQRIASAIIAADRDLRFLSDEELGLIEREVAGDDEADGAMLRRNAALIMRDFKGTIVEGAKETLEAEMPRILTEGVLASARVAGAYWEEVKHLHRLAHYATAAGVAKFADEEQAAMLHRALAREGIEGEVIGMSLMAMQKRSNFLCKCSQAAPKCWVASHYAFSHLIETVVAEAA